jgi:hypothetical protein
MEGKCAFPKQALKIVSSNRFAERAPDLLGFFQKYETGSALISQALAHLDETKASYEEVAAWLLRQNDGLIDQWRPAENAPRLRAYLDDWSVIPRDGFLTDYILKFPNRAFKLGDAIDTRQGLFREHAEALRAIAPWCRGVGGICGAMEKTPWVCLCWLWW